MNEDLELITFSEFHTTYLCVLGELKEARLINRWLESESFTDDIAEVAQTG